MAAMKRPIVTAVGRLLTPKHGEPVVHSVIKVAPDGSAKEVIRRTLPGPLAR